MTHTITEQRDELGRSTGYTYAKNDIPQQQTTIGYGADGRIATAGFTHQGEHKVFTYSYFPGTHLLHTLTHPNGLTLTQSYEPLRDLPTQMDYTRADALIVRRGYTYDILGRPTTRDLARYGTETRDTFGYNTRSELTTAHVNSADYSYAYDAIGNRAAAVENSSGVASRTEYRTNNLNQYTAEGSFRPTFDADGNQTQIKTSTGTWNVTYNAKNRPVLFTKSDGSVTVECTYDTMGRRATKKVITNGTLTEHRRFLYRGYLQIACCDLTRAYTPALWYILWESPRGLGGGLDNARSGIAPKGRAGNGVPASHPTQPTATRPLSIQKNGTWYTYGWDLTKNICETYRTDARIDLAYTYTPYGEASPAHAYDQPLRWSSEYHDTELGLVYYNYRHYNLATGRWLKIDDVPPHRTTFCNNSPSTIYDILGRSFSLNLHGNMQAFDRSGKKLITEHDYFETLIPPVSNEIYTISSHGDRTAVFGYNQGKVKTNEMSYIDLAKYMYQHGYHEGQNVILYACNTGNDSQGEAFAQLLANELYRISKEKHPSGCPQEIWVEGLVDIIYIKGLGNGDFAMLDTELKYIQLQFKFDFVNNVTDLVIEDPAFKRFYAPPKKK